MAPEAPPERPPWRAGMTPTADQMTGYARYLMAEIKVRDLKHERLANHVRAHCQ